MMQEHFVVVYCTYIWIFIYNLHYVNSLIRYVRITYALLTYLEKAYKQGLSDLLGATPQIHVESGGTAKVKVNKPRVDLERQLGFQEDEAS